MSRMHPPRRAQGLTLIELLMFIVVVGIALAAMLRVFVTATMASADPMILRQQLAIAESLLREVQLMPFTWCDPDDANVETATSSAGCATLVENSGPESGETRYGPTTYFDNVNDYAGFSMTGIKDLSNAAVAGLAGYSASVAVVADTLEASTLTAGSGDALKITVTVLGPNGKAIDAVVLQGWRTRYAPTSPY